MTRNSAPTTIASTCDWLKSSCASFGSFRPIACATTVVVPTPSICVSASTMKVRLPAMATPATDAVPSRPTQYKSTRKYSVWKIIVTSMKPVVFNRCPLIGPVVMSVIEGEKDSRGPRAEGREPRAESREPSMCDPAAHKRSFLIDAPNHPAHLCPAHNVRLRILAVARDGVGRVAGADRCQAGPTPHRRARDRVARRVLQCRIQHGRDQRLHPACGQHGLDR